MSTYMQFIIICPMVFLAGFIDAIAGGGGLISLPTYLIAGIPVHMAIGTNKLSSGMGTALATWRFAKKGLITWKIAAYCAVCALVGSTTGAKLALMLKDDIFKIVMLIIIPLTAIYVLKGRSFNKEYEPLHYTKTLIISLFASLIIGVYDGFYGPGTGTFLLLLLTGLAHMRLGEANGVTKVINLTTNIAALTVYLLNSKVIIPLGLVAGCFSIAGNYMGTRVFLKGGARSTRPIIVIVLVIFFVKVLYEVITK